MVSKNCLPPKQQIHTGAYSRCSAGVSEHHLSHSVCLSNKDPLLTCKLHIHTNVLLHLSTLPPRRPVFYHVVLFHLEYIKNTYGKDL